MRFVTMDDEGRDLLEAGVEMAHAALDARARRVDPDGLVSRSVAMSKIKTASLLKCLREPPMAEFSELSAKDKAIARDLMKMFLAATDKQEEELIWRKFRAVTLVRAKTDRKPEKE